MHQIWNVGTTCELIKNGIYWFLEPWLESLYGAQLCDFEWRLPYVMSN